MARDSVYILATDDIFEFPIFEGTPADIAVFLGMRTNSLRSSIARNYKLRYGKEKLLCIKIGDKSEVKEVEE